jgi:hypothetical protein
MSLKEILEKIISTNEPYQLWDGSRSWNAAELLRVLSAARLKTRAHLQPGIYIAEISEAGYLGQVMYTLKTRK